jgi:hypothetical protein
MLGGDTITDGLRQSAREMLGARHRDRPAAPAGVGESERAKAKVSGNTSKTAKSAKDTKAKARGA